MKKYSSYINSGIDWLGEIPSHWPLRKLKHTVELNSRESATEEISLKVALENIESGSGKHLPTETPGFEGIGNVFQTDDVLFSKLRPYLAKVLHAKNEGLAVGEILVLTPNKQVYDSRFLFFRLLSQAFINVVDSSTYGSKMPRASWSFIKELKLPVPPLPEQRAIAAYLDHKTAQLDTLLTQKEALLQLLHKKRQAIINEAVTQGLDPTAPRKPSGVAWLGDVPAHWEVKKLKYLFKASLGGGTPDTTNDSFWNGDLPWVSPKDMKSSVISTTQDYVTELAVKSSSTSLIPENSVMVVVRSGILKHTFPVAVNSVPVTLNQDMKAFVPNNLITAEYLAHLLKGFQQHILNQCTKIGATVDSIETEWLYSFPFPVPPREEQERIVEYLHKSNTQINEAATAIHTQIKALKAYRQSLISEVVTGKVDVRAAKTVAPEADLPLWRQLV